MQTKAFSGLLKQLKSLTSSQKEKLQFSLHQNSVLENIADAIDTPQSCPHCSSRKYQKWEIRVGLQHYRCSVCHKTYNTRTGTLLARLRHKPERLLGILSMWGMICQPLVQT